MFNAMFEHMNLLHHLDNHEDAAEKPVIRYYYYKPEQSTPTVRVHRVWGVRVPQPAYGDGQQQSNAQQELKIVCTASTSRVVKEFKFPDGASMPEVPDEFCCPLSIDIMREPVVASDGFTY